MEKITNYWNHVWRNRENLITLHCLYCEWGTTSRFIHGKCISNSEYCSFEFQSCICTISISIHTKFSSSTLNGIGAFENMLTLRRLMAVEPHSRVSRGIEEYSCHIWCMNVIQYRSLYEYSFITLLTEVLEPVAIFLIKVSLMQIHGII